MHVLFWRIAHFILKFLWFWAIQVIHYLIQNLLDVQLLFRAKRFVYLQTSCSFSGQNEVNTSFLTEKFQWIVHACAFEVAEQRPVFWWGNHKNFITSEMHGLWRNMPFVYKHTHVTQEHVGHQFFHMLGLY